MKISKTEQKIQHKKTSISGDNPAYNITTQTNNNKIEYYKAFTVSVRKENRKKKDKHGVNSHEAFAYFDYRVVSSTRSLNLVFLGERVKVWGNIRRNITTKIVLHTVTIHLEIRTIRSQNSHKPDHEAHSTH
uniref:Uncharacterized protein n=1 Tax=Tanacetum cinerariifolium TaxID=118510 RepID=A0A6L2NTM6_TANCI|nr:hypothetical protein [Tanacetum cinerariifolium]